VLPLVILAVYLAINHVHTLEDQRNQEAINQAHNIATSIDHHLEAQIAALQMLAASPLLDDPPRLNELYNEARGFRESFGGHVILADLSMQMIFNTRAPLGAVLPRLPVPKGRAAAPEALETGRPAVGDMFPGPIAKEPLVAVAAPVLRNGQTKFLLLSIIETRRFQQRVDEVALPTGWSVSILDGKDEVMALRSLSEIEDRSSNAEGTRRFVAKSGVSHWSVVLEVPQGIYRAPVISAGAALAVVIVVVTLVSVLGGRLASRRLARSVASLTEMPLSHVSHPLIAEIEIVRSLMEHSAAARDAAEAIKWESEQRFQQLFQVAPIPLCFVDKDGVLVSSNARFKQTFGYSQEDVPTLHEWFQLAYPDPDYRRLVVDTWDAAVQRARANNADIEPMEYRVTSKSGKVLTMIISGTILGDDFLAAFFDVTERKQAEEALFFERNKFRRFLDSLPVGVYIVDDRYDIEYVNPVILHEFGPVEGRKCHEYFHGRTEACPWCKNPEVFAGKTVRWEWSPEKTGKTYDLIDTPVYSTDGRISKLEVFIDITARKEAEKGLRRYELLAALSRDIILFMRRDDGRILEANAAASDAYGYSREELLTMTIHDLRSPDTAGLTANQMKTAYAQGILFETVHRRKDGATFPVEVSSRGAIIDGVGALISVVRDIAERKCAEMKLRNSLEEKTALLKEIHHRVKNNLQIVVSLLGLQANCTNNPEALDILKDTRNRVRSMALLHEVLYRSENLARISFAAYIGDLCRQIVSSFGKSAWRVKVESRVEEIGLPLDQAVPCGLIINELVSNALKHAFPGERSGSVMVELGATARQMLLLRVHDDGVGLPPGMDPENTSTLGLQLVFELAGQLDGRVTVERPGEGGAGFQVYFPVRKEMHRGGET
jgi:PAS domain S-box-containing protein